MNYLIVVEHPDDEVLGAGASIYKWTRQGDKVDVCNMSIEAKVWFFRPEDKELDDDLNASSDFLGTLIGCFMKKCLIWMREVQCIMGRLR